MHVMIPTMFINTRVCDLFATLSEPLIIKWHQSCLSKWCQINCFTIICHHLMKSIVWIKKWPPYMGFSRNHQMVSIMLIQMMSNKLFYYYLISFIEIHCLDKEMASLYEFFAEPSNGINHVYPNNVKQLVSLLFYIIYRNSLFLLPNLSQNML